MADNNPIQKPILVEIAPNEWVSINSSEAMKLTIAEIEKAKKLNLSIDKFTTVKKLLFQGNSISAINSSSKISRVTIYKYRNLLDECTLENLSIIQSMYSQNTQKAKSVQCNLLFLSLFSSQCTVFFSILSFILLLIGGVVLWYKWKAYLELRALHYTESGYLFNLYLRAIDFKYRQDVIICQTDKQRIWYQKILTAFGNGGRLVKVLPLNYGEKWIDYDYRREHFRCDWHRQNREKINEANQLLKKETKRLKKLGYLDYLYKYKHKNWLHSKAFLYAFIEPLQRHPEPLYGKFRKPKPIEKILNH